MPSIQRKIELNKLINELIEVLKTLASPLIGLNPYRITNKLIPQLEKVRDELSEQDYSTVTNKKLSTHFASISLDDNSKERTIDTDILAERAISCLSTPLSLIDEVKLYAEKHEQHKNYSNMNDPRYINTANVYKTFLEIVNQLKKYYALAETNQLSPKRLGNF